jgi:hypothetical protein
MGFAAVRLETGKQSSRAGRLHCQGEWSRQPQSFSLLGSVHPRPGRDHWKPLMDFALNMADEGALDPRSPSATWSATPCPSCRSAASPCQSAASCREQQVLVGATLVWPVIKESGPGDREEATLPRSLEPCQFTARWGARRTRGRGRRHQSCRLRFRNGPGGS